MCTRYTQSLSDMKNLGMKGGKEIQRAQSSLPPVKIWPTADLDGPVAAAMAVKKRGTASFPSIPIQILHKGPKYNVQTC